MDENNYTKLITDQLTSLYISASAVLPADHRTVQVLSDAVRRLNSEDAFTPAAEPVRANFLPAGFTEEDFNEFLTENEITPPVVDEYTVNTPDVVGMVVDNEGNYTETGNVVESAAAAAAAVAEIEEEEGEEIITDNLITISYKRLDSEDLTVQNVHTILNHPISEPLKNLGTIQLISVDAGEDASEKKAVFAILEEGTLSLKTLAVGVTSYRGISVFPGLGRVQAVGTVNYL